MAVPEDRFTRPAPKRASAKERAKARAERAEKLAKLERFIGELRAQFGQQRPTEWLPVMTGAIVSRGMAGPLYHGTAESLLSRILKEGLRPATETGVRHYTSAELASRFPGVYVTRSPWNAWSIAVNAADRFRSNPVLLRISRLPTAPFWPDEDALARHLLNNPNLKALWRGSFRMGHDLFSEVTRRALQRPEVQLAVKEAPALGRLLQQLEGARRSWSRFPVFPMGNVAYEGRIPPELLNVVARGMGGYEVLQEGKRLENLLAGVLAVYLRRRMVPPWWIR